MMTAGLHHVALVTRSAARAQRFYGEVLGLSVAPWSAEMAPAYKLVMGDASASPGTLLLFTEEGSEARGHWGVGGVHHVALGTATRAELLQWKRWLTAHDVRVSGPYDRGWFHSIYFADPDGQILEIATRGPGYTLDEAPDRLGEKLIVPDAARMRGARDEAAIAAETSAEPVAEITPAMALDGVHHVTGLTDDMDAAHAFHTEQLGLRRVKQTVNQDDGRTAHWFWARHDGWEVAPHSTITLFDWRGSTYRARSGAGQLRHIAWRASHDDELAAWHERLHAGGTVVQRTEDLGAFRIVHFGAPDGQALAIATDVRR